MVTTIKAIFHSYASAEQFCINHDIKDYTIEYHKITGCATLAYKNKIEEPEVIENKEIPADKLLRDIQDFIKSQGYEIEFPYDENLDDYTVTKDGKRLFSVEIY